MAGKAWRPGLKPKDQEIANAALKGRSSTLLTRAAACRATSGYLRQQANFSLAARRA